MKFVLKKINYERVAGAQKQTGYVDARLSYRKLADKRSIEEESQSSSGSAYKAPERLADRRSTCISMSRMWTLFSNEHWRQALRNVSP